MLEQLVSKLQKLSALSTPTCPKCKQVIPSDDINVAKDIAYCRTCNLTHKLSTLAQINDLESGIDLNTPPPGAWRRQEGVETVIGATHRALGTAVAALFFCLFWNGIVSVFVLLNIASTFRHLHISVPSSFPAPKMNGSLMSVGMTIFLWIFLTPFILIGLGMIWAFLSSLAGRTEVRITGAQGVVFTGIGAIGWPRRFDPATITDVRLEDLSWNDNESYRRRNSSIVLETREGKQIRFGSSLSNDRRKFVAAAVRHAVIR
jgi:hypothetical protein